MGLFGKVFGKEDKKDSCCCDMEICLLYTSDAADV